MISPRMQGELLNEVGTTMGQRKTKTPARDHLIRHSTHVTDEKARRHFQNSIPPEWVVNPFVNDYGKDYHVDVVGSDGRVGRAFYVQLKGTAGCATVAGGTAVGFPLERKHLAYYMAEARLPVFLVVVDVAAGRGYWVFVQGYLAQTPGWEAGDSHTVRIPTANRLDDPAGLAEAVTDALYRMAAFHQKPHRELVREHIQSLEEKDPRFRVSVTYGEGEEVRLTAKEPVPLTIRLNPKRKRHVARMRTDLFDKGKPVRFSPGEIRVDGSALVDELLADGGVLQLRARADAQLTLSSPGSGPVLWQGLAGEIAGGLKEHGFTSRLAGCPVSVAVGPFGSGQRRAIRLSITPTAWDGQPVLRANYFEKVEALFGHLARHTDVRAECEVGGNRVFSVLCRLDNTGVLAEWLALLDVVRKARVAARHYRVDPTFSLVALDGGAVRAVEIAYAVATGGGYELAPADLRATATFDKSTVRAFLAGPPVVSDLTFCLDGTDRCPIFGAPVNLGRLGWELSEAALDTPVAELKRLLKRPGRGVPVGFRTTRNSRGVLKAFSTDEWRDIELHSPGRPRGP